MLNADLLIRDARIRTMDPGRPEVRSMAIFNGRILTLAQDDDLGFTAGPDTTELDLGGKTVMLGFIDAHEHLSWFAENDLKLDLSPNRVKSLVQLKDLISEQARLAKAGDWIRGFGYDDTKIAEARRLTRDDLVQRIHDIGYQGCLHANGDLAIEMALNAIERAMNLTNRPDPRHRIEHCTMVDDRLLQRMAKFGVIALPFTSYIWQHAEKLRPYYGDRADRMFAHKSFLNAGIIPAAGSDHPVGLHPALLGVQCMVTRKTLNGEVIGEGEKLSLNEAFKVYTTYAAHASGEEKIKGSATPGRLADMVVLAKDPWETDPDEIADIDVEMTIVNGKIIYNVESA